MIEVHTGARPGRPTLLLVLSAVVLAAMLALAWVQAFEGRALGPETRIPGTKLIVRAPRDWQQHPEYPDTFFLPTNRRIRGHDHQVIDRRITFSVVRAPASQSVTEYIAALDRSEGLRTAERKVCRIGPLDAVQVRRVVPPPLNRTVLAQEQLLRVARTPRGELIRVKYVPLIMLTDADSDIVEDVCAAVRLDDPAFGAEPAALLAHAGVEFDIPEEWSIVGPDIPEAPGLYLGGSLDNGRTWSLGVFRTWLAGGRTPKTLLADCASATWGVPAEDVRVAAAERPDGVKVAQTRHPGPDVGAHHVSSIWLIAQSASEVALVFVYSDAALAEVGYAAAEQLANKLEFVGENVFPKVEDAEAAGRALIAGLVSDGALTELFGTERRQFYYLSEGGDGSEAFFLGHTPHERGPTFGYVGGVRHRFQGGLEERSWTVDAEAVAYSHKVESSRATRRGRTTRTVREQRNADAQTVTRTIETPRGRNTQEFQVGPAFVCPPLESRVEWLVARGDDGAWIIEAVARHKAGTETRLLRPLPPDEDGFRRVLVQRDLSPSGTIIAFNEAGELQYEEHLSSRLTRVTREEMERQFPNFLRDR